MTGLTSAPLRLVVFAVGLALVFVAGLVIGDALGPDVSDMPARHGHVE